MTALLIRHKRSLFCLLQIYSIVLLLTAPLKYNYVFNCTCTVSYVVFIILYFIVTAKKNFMDFDTMFFIAFFFVSFFYPTFIYPIDPQMLWLFKFAVDQTTINYASALCLSGICAYMWGSVFVNYRNKPGKMYRYMNTRGLFLFSLFSFIIYIWFGGLDAVFKMYSEGERDMGGIYSYFSVIVYVCIFCMISIWFKNSYLISKTKFQWKAIPKGQAIYVIIYMAFLLFAGSRGKVINITLMTLGFYAYLYRPFSLRKVLILTVFGMLAMFGIVYYRSGGAFSANSVADIAMDLIVTNRNTYESISIVRDKGISYGYSMLSYLVGIVPFMQNIVFTLMDIDPDTASSAMIITKSTLGTTSGTGTGSTIIADLYLAFGPVGVCVFMWIFGRITRYLTFYCKDNIYLFTIYGVLMGMSVYLARAEYLYPARILFWCTLIVFLRLHLVINAKRK